MSGHSHWAGIKHKKGVADQKRGVAFSKLLAAISATAKSESNPDFNPRLRTAIEKAKEQSVPAENIERAVKRASDSADDLEELTFECYGPGGVAIIVEAISDSRNRTVAEIKKVLSDFGGKWAESGSVRWAFNRGADERGRDADPLRRNFSEASQRGTWRPKFTQEIGEEEKNKLKELIGALEEHDDVQKVYTNAR
ncbi:MAG: YebC/PmpR family DNA-binding transcriptional regulator [Candidatus Liptonbacteria bacterium]|nr:YebC/PmpR family DNA-binding transcriptional regulator [Candidatus Liptonbacteria bacterium]